MPNTQEKIAYFEARIQQLKAREKTTERKRRTRRLILLGTIADEMMVADPDFARSFLQRAEGKFTRRIDRQALGLAVRDADETVPG